MKKVFLIILSVFLLLPLLSEAGKKKEAKKKVKSAKVISLKPGDILIADFEGHPNCLNGEVGVYGDGEPDWSKPDDPHSWYLEPHLKDYKKSNVHSGAQCFRLVNGQKGVSKRWASFGVDLGPDVDISMIPKKVKSLDISKFKYLVFWVKGEKGGEKFKVLFRDSHAPSYMPQAKINPFPKGCSTKWQQVVILLSEIKNSVDLKSMDHVGLEFGSNVGNPKLAIFYVDDFAFVK